MAVDADSYGTVARVEAIVGDIAANATDPREFATTTIPTLEQVEGFIDDVASELNVALINAGYTSPVVVGTDKAAFNYLRHANSCGAVLLVLDSLPLDAYETPNPGGPPTGRRGHCQNVYLAALRIIEQERLTADRATGGTHLSDLKVGSATDSDGNTNKPIFKRGDTDYPSSRSLTKA